MQRRLLRSAAAAVLAVTGIAGRAHQAAAQCTIVIEVDGRYRAEQRPAAGLTFELSYGTDVPVENPVGCRGKRLSGPVDVDRGNVADALYFHLLNELARDLDHAGGGHREETAQAFHDLNRMLDAASGRLLGDSVIDGAVTTLADLLPARGFPAKLGRAVATELLRAYLRDGRSPADLGDTALGLLGDLAADVSGSDLPADFVALIRPHLAALGVTLRRQFPDQTLIATASEDGCEYTLNTFWTPRGGAFHVVSGKSCGDTGRLANVVVTLPASDPGDAVAGTVRATDSLGRPVAGRGVGAGAVHGPRPQRGGRPDRGVGGRQRRRRVGRAAGDRGAAPRGGDGAEPEL